MKTVFFYHIPKTGGMSIRKSVLAALGRHHVCDNYADERAYEKYDPRSRAGFRFVTGHFPVGVHHHCPVDHALITILRHPIERCVSFARMVASRPAHIFGIHRPTPPLELFRQRHPELCDAMTKRLAGVGPTGSWPATTNTVNWARQNLAQFTHIGFTDDLPRTFAVLSDLLEISLTPSHVNAAPNFDPDGLDEFRAQVAALNRADIDLYEECLAGLPTRGTLLLPAAELRRSIAPRSIGGCSGCGGEKFVPPVLPEQQDAILREHFTA